MTILQYNLARLNHARQVADFDQRIREEFRNEAIEQRNAELDRLRREKHEAACNTPGVGVWEIDAAGNVIGKYASGTEAAAMCGIKRTTLIAAMNKGSWVRKSRRFMRCGVKIPLPFRRQTRMVRRVSDGKVFESVTELAKSLKAKHGSVWRVITEGRLWEGERYEFAD